jgi:ureidoglycolate lyase
MTSDLPLFPLTEAAFAPFGTLVEYARLEHRRVLVRELQNSQPDARANLDFATVPMHTLPVTATVMERHLFSSQSFVPIDVKRYLVVVAPDALAGGGPDMAHARVFAASGRQSVTYRAGVWHHPLTALDREDIFVIVTFRAGTAADEEFVSLPEPVRLGA